jgi:pyrophosphatase PpaX
VRPKAVLFDLDGTLLDSIPGIVASFRHALERHLPERLFTDRELIATIGEPLPTQMLQFAAGDAAIAAAMADDYRTHNAGLIPTFPLFPDVHAALDELRGRGFVTGLVTSKYRPSAAISLESHGLLAKFDLIMTADDTPRHKPDPMPLVVAAERLGIETGAIYYVGDSVHDLRCANAAGCPAIAALWGPFAEADLRALKPAYAVRSLREMLAIQALAR